MNSLRIFLADDHTVMRAGLKSLVNAQSDMDVVGEADDGRDTLQKVREIAEKSRGPDRGGYRDQFIRLIEKSQSLHTEQ